MGSFFLVKSKTLGSVISESNNVIRRTASLDTIYLKGQWPRETYWQMSNLQIDKSTQTDENDWVDSRKIHSIAEIDDKIDKMTVRHKLARSNITQQSGRHVISPGGDHTLSASSQTNTCEYDS